MKFYSRPAIWISVGSAFIGLVSLLLGASVLYVVGQFIALLGLAAFVELSPRMPFAINFVIIATLTKNFALSQMLKLLFMQSPDTDLREPIKTVFVVVAGTAGCVAAACLYAIVSPRFPKSTFLSRQLPRRATVAAGSLLVAVGLVSTIIELRFPLSSVIFHYAAGLSYAGAAAFAYNRWLSSGCRQILDWRVVAVVGSTLALSLQSDAKAAILAPFVFVGVLYLFFKVRPHFAVVVAGFSAFLMIAAVVYPVSNYLRALGQADSFNMGKALLEVAEAPHLLTDYNSFSDVIEEHWQTRLYYGRPAGILDRFTPNQISDLVVARQRTHLDAVDHVKSSIVALIPQQFGKSRDASVGEEELEGAVIGTPVQQTTSANYGLMADSFLYAGYGGSFLGMFAITGLLFLLYVVAFGSYQYSLWALPYAVGQMFTMADQGLTGCLISLVHGSIIQWGILGVIILVLRRGR